MQCEHVLHCTMELLGYKSESESTPESVSVNVNKGGDRSKEIVKEQLNVVLKSCLFHKIG